jgi:subfamily B ATP-binding cassette protein MsbA
MTPVSVDTPATAGQAEATAGPRRGAPMPEADPPQRRIPSEKRQAGQRDRPAQAGEGYAGSGVFAGTRRGFIGLRRRGRRRSDGAAIPALLKVILDDGMKQNGFPLWLVPIAIIGLTVIRGLAGFISQYGLACGQPRHYGRCDGRCSAPLDAEPLLFTRNTASNLVNTSPSRFRPADCSSSTRCRVLVGDSLHFVALLSSMVAQLQLTVFVGRAARGRLRHPQVQPPHARLTVEGQHSVDALAYVVEENVIVLAQRPPACRRGLAGDALRESQRQAAPAVDEVGGGGRDLTPIRRCSPRARSAVIVAALWQSSRGDGTAGGFVAFIVAMLRLIRR